MTGESFVNPVYNEANSSTTATAKDAVTMATVPEVAESGMQCTGVKVESSDCERDQPAKIAVVEVTNEMAGMNGCHSNGVDPSRDDICKDYNKNGHEVKVNGTDMTVDVGDKKPILEEDDKKKKKKGKKEKRDKKSLENVLKKLRHGDDGIGGAGDLGTGSVNEEKSPSNKYVYL